VSYSGLHESREEVDTSPIQIGPTKYTLFTSSLSVTFKPSLLGLTFGGAANTYAFQNSPVFGGGPNLVNTGRDQTIYSGFGQLSYDFSPGYSLSVRGTFNSDHPNSALSAQRPTQGMGVDAGVEFLLSHLVEGSVYCGYLHQQYTAPLPDVSGLDFGAELKWYPSELFTVDLKAGRQIQYTTLALVSAGDNKFVVLSADYELTRVVHLTANVNYDDVDYVGSVPSRDDTTPRFGVGGRWLFSQHASLDLNYNYVKRSSTVPTAPEAAFTDNLVSAALNFQI
jgi:hypothetical protein